MPAKLGPSTASNESTSIEQEINEDVANDRLTACFNAVLNAAPHLAELHATMPPPMIWPATDCYTNA